MSDDSDVYPELSKLCYWEYSENDGYYYYLQFGPYDYNITPHGVSVCREDGSSTLMNLIPLEIFGETKMLTDSQLCFILSLPIKGTTHSKEQMEGFYREFKEQNVDGRPNSNPTRSD